MNFSLPKAVEQELQKLSAPPSAQKSIVDFCILLDKWNQKMNLSGSKSPDDLATEHVLDTLRAAQHLPVSEAFLDIGSGAGFPGIILGMLWPEREGHLVEPKEKSATFLKEAVKNLGLSNVTIYVRAIEDLQGEEVIPIYQEYFSISRAFSPMKKFLGHCSYLVREESPLFLMTGENSEVLDEAALAKYQLFVAKSTKYDSDKPKKLLVEIRKQL